MAVKKCVKCGSSWSSALLKCAFCGGEGVEEREPDKVVLPGEAAAAAEPAKAPAAVETAPSPAPTPPSAPHLEGLTPLPPAGPKAPAGGILLAFSILGLLACVLFPVAHLIGAEGSAGAMLYLTAGILTPFVPVAWLAASKYEDHCHGLNVLPQPRGVLARVLAETSLVLLSVEVAILCVVIAVMRLSEHGPA